MGNSRALAKHAIREIRRHMFGPHMLAFAPALLLGTIWYGPKGALMIAALALPPFVLAMLRPSTRSGWATRAGIGGLPDRTAAAERLAEEVHAWHQGRSDFACFVLEVDHLPEITHTYGADMSRRLVDTAVDRLSGAVRDRDLLARLDASRLVIVSGPMRIADTETMVQIAGRFQKAAAEAVIINGLKLDISVSVGFCSPRISTCSDAGSVMQGAENAMVAARNAGPGAIRAYVADQLPVAYEPGRLFDEFVPALMSGQITARYQPIISTDTGATVAMDASPCWEHPELGHLAWAEFRVAAITSGETDRMRSMLMHHALGALRGWRRAGHEVPAVCVTLGTLDLADPNLCEKLIWELDRFDMTATDLWLAVKESSVTRPLDDAILRNLNKLCEAGFDLTVSGFGAGSASISVLRGIGIRHLRVDRSFVVDIDNDRDQQKMLNGLISLADHISMDVHADGVESLGEHAMLAQIGCARVQGTSIARAMVVEETGDWLGRHAAKLQTVRLPVRPEDRRRA